MVDAVSGSPSLAQTQLSELIAGGNLEAAVALVQRNRIESQDEGLKIRLSDMQSRNDTIGLKNSMLAGFQEQIGRLEGAEGQEGAKASIQSQMTRVKGEIDSLNSDSQIDTIGLQDLINKRQQAIDLWSNAISKFGKTADTIIGNTR